MKNSVKIPISSYINSDNKNGTSITERIEERKRTTNQTRSSVPNSFLNLSDTHTNSSLNNSGVSEVTRIQQQALNVPKDLVNWRYFPDELKEHLYGKKYRKQPKGISCERTREYEETVESYGVDDDFYWLGLPE